MSQSLNTNMNAVTYPRTGKRGVPQQFPRRLYKMLQSESGKSSHGMISWSESGEAFRIADVAIFSSIVLPMYFKTSKFSSFQRNLNLYGFSKARRGPNTDMYAHPAFLRGRPELLSQLKKSAHSTDRTRCSKAATLAKKKILRHTKEKQESCDRKITVRTISPCSLSDELQRSICTTDDHECSRVLENDERDFNAPNITKGTTDNCQFTGGDRYSRTSITRSSTDIREINIPTQASVTSMLPNGNGRLALLAIVMASVADQDSTANTIQTTHGFGMNNLKTHLRLQYE